MRDVAFGSSNRTPIESELKIPGLICGITIGLQGELRPTIEAEV